MLILGFLCYPPGRFEFALYLGIAGSITLTAFGLGALLSRPKPEPIHNGRKRLFRSSSYFSLWLKGFLINTINLSLFFLLDRCDEHPGFDGGLDTQEATLFGAIFGTIVFTDLSKVILAKRIRRVLRPVHLLWLRRISGGALIVFAVVLLVRVVRSYWGVL